MGFRFRKSVKLGPVRVNLSKSGVGYSVGGKGLRFTKKAGGGTRTTASIPGTGVSYVKDSGSGKRTSRKTTHKNTNSGTPVSASSGIAAGGGAAMNNNNPELPISEKAFTELLLCFLLGWAGGHKFYKKKWGMGILYLFTLGLFGIGWIGDCIRLCMENFGKNKGTPLSKGKKWGIYIVAFVCVALLGSCNSGSAPAATPTEPPKATETAIIETTLAPTETVDAVTEATSQSIDEIAAQESTAAMDQTSEPTEAPTQTPTEPEPETHVYVLNTGTHKFHYEWCNSVDDMKESNKKILETTREDVISRGYEPCGRCKP